MNLFILSPRKHASRVATQLTKIILVGFVVLVALLVCDLVVSLYATMSGVTSVYL